MFSTSTSLAQRLYSYSKFTNAAGLSNQPCTSAPSITIESWGEPLVARFTYKSIIREILFREPLKIALVKKI